MRILMAMLIALSLTGCATNFSSLDDPGSKGASSLIIGDAEAVKVSLRQAIVSEYPTDEVNEYANGIFMWSHMPFMDKTSFRLQMFGGTGLDENKQQIHGYFYTIETYGTQAAVDARYVQPLRRAIEKSLRSNGLKTTRVSLLSKATLTQEGKALQDEVNACYAHIESDPAVAALKSKIDFEDGDATFAMMTDTSKPTTEEKTAIRRMGQLTEQCMALQHKAMKAMDTPPQLKAAMDSQMTSYQALIAQLYMGNLTYGEFASKVQAVMNNYREEASRTAAELKKAANEERDRERQIDATRNSGPVIVQPAPARSTTCTYGGGMMICN